MTAKRAGIAGARIALDDLPEAVTPLQLRQALDCDGATIARMEKAGSLPPRIPGTRRWYREAVKARLRQVSGLDDPTSPEATIAQEEQDMLRRARGGRDRSEGAVP
jgi:hypothetical protein